MIEPCSDFMLHLIVICSTNGIIEAYFEHLTFATNYVILYYVEVMYFPTFSLCLVMVKSKKNFFDKNSVDCLIVLNFSFFVYANFFLYVFKMWSTKMIIGLNVKN